MTDEERFIQLRESFEAELVELEGKLPEIQERLTNLLNRQVELKDLLYGKPKPKIATSTGKPPIRVDRVVDKKMSRPESSLVAFIKKNPGSTRKAIREGMPPLITEAGVANALSTLSKKGIIENRGNKTQSSWYFVG